MVGIAYATKYVGFGAYVAERYIRTFSIVAWETLA